MNPTPCTKVIAFAATLSLCSLLAAQGSGESAIGTELRVSGTGAGGSTLGFWLSSARPDAFALFVLSATRGPLVTPGLTLCVDRPIAFWPMSAIDANGTAELQLPLPPLPADFAVQLFAQAVVVPSSYVTSEIRTSNVASVPLFGPPSTLAVTNVAPLTGGAGTPVTITGTGFGSDASRVTVWLDAQPLAPSSVTETAIQLTLPYSPTAGALPLAVQVGVPRVAAGTFAFTSVSAPGPIPGWVNVGFPTVEATHAADLDARVRAAGGRVRDLHLGLTAAAVTVAPGREAAFASAVLAQSASYAEQDELDQGEDMGDRGAPSDPVRATQWHIDLVGGQLVPYSRDPIIAMIDSGVERTHSDLVGRLLLPARIDLDFVEKKASPDDQNGHGTQTTGIVGAVSDNNKHATGMVRDLSILPLRTGDANGDHSHKARAYAISLAVAYAKGLKRPLVLNISTGIKASSLLLGALRNADAQGAVIVKSAGNKGGDITYAAPTAAWPDLVIVSGIARARDAGGRLQISATSARAQVNAAENRKIDVAAPSEQIVTLDRGDTTVAITGTSHAAPQVTAAIAGIWSWTPKLATDSDLSWRSRVLDMLHRGCVRDIGAGGRDELFGHGVLDITGRAFFHTRDRRMQSQRSKPEASDLRGLFQVRDYAAERGMNPRYAGDRLMFACDRSRAGLSESVVRSLDPAEGYNIAPVGILAAFGEPVGQPAFDPRSNEWLCVVRSGALWAVTQRGTSWRQLTIVGPMLHTPHWAATGTHIVFADYSAVLEIEVRRDAQGDIVSGGAVRSVLGPTPGYSYLTPSYAPDAVPAQRKGRVAFAAMWSEPSGILRTELYHARLEGGDYERLTMDGAQFSGDGVENFGPAWTPDGARIVFHTLMYRNSRSEYRHLVRAIPASPGGAPMPAVLHDTGWSTIPIPMGMDGTSVCYSAVDATRF